MAICWISSYPKSGNTWFRAFLTNYIEQPSAPADIDTLLGWKWASQRSWLDSVLGFDSSLVSYDEINVLRPYIYAWAGQRAGIEYYKVHERFSKNKQGKPIFAGGGIFGCVYIVRNPLDVAVSYAHHLDVTIDDAVSIMTDPEHAIQVRQGKYSPHVRQHIGTWSENVTSWTANRFIPVHVIRYEDMYFQPLVTFSKVLDFLRFEPRPNAVEKAMKFSKFGEMRRQEMSGRFHDKPATMEKFFRRGITGDWKNVLTDAQISRIIDAHGPAMAEFSYL